MKALILLLLLSPVLLMGCDNTDATNQNLKAENLNSKPMTQQNEVSVNVTHATNTIKEPQNPNIPDYNAQTSLNRLLNSDDSRELVYLMHPTKEMFVYCYHALTSECHIEGLHKGEFFTYDISQVEGQNKGKLTFHTQNIESAKTTPIKWMTVNDEYVMVQMTSKLILNSQQNTLHEPLLIDYKKGMMVR